MSSLEINDGSGRSSPVARDDNGQDQDQDELEALYRMNPDITLGPETADRPRTEHETHCDYCFDLKDCLRETKLRLRKQEPLHITCPVVSCSLNCSMKFHECKKVEHLLICARVKVPCINANYGCHSVMERRMTGPHLATCPASVVVCTVEWNRKPLPPWETRLELSEHSTHLDVAALIRDEKTVSEFNSKLPSNLKAVLKPRYTKHPVMPLGVSGHRIPNCILEEAKLEKEAGDVPENDEDEDTFNSFTAEGLKKVPDGLQESVCSKLRHLTFVSSAPPAEQKSESALQVTPSADKVKPKSLSMMVDVINKSGCKYINLYTFMCAQEFRRDEYANHFKTTHTEIVTQVNGWLFKRCPMTDYGCTFGVEHIFPDLSDGKNYKIVYNEVLGAFCATQVQDESSDPKPDESMANLNGLPFEVLVRLTRYLDPLSLNALSMTSRNLREVCEYVVPERGIVVFDWDRNPETGKWEVAAKKWIFSTSFSPIRKWRFSDVAVVSNHMKTCACYNETRHRPEKPFSYPVTLNDL